MSILINIEMPTSEEKCKFFHPAPFRAPFCVINGVCHGIDDCPLKPIPPHGRLVDVEQLKEKIIRVVCFPGENHGCHDCYRMEDCKILKAFEDVPTILEAEDGT